MTNQYDIERNGLKCTLSVIIPRENVVKVYKSELNKLCQKARVNGFRKGRLSPRAAEQRFGQGLSEQICQQFHQDGFDEGIKQHELHVAGGVDLKEGGFNKDKSYEFAVHFECLPTVDQEALKKIKLKRTVCPVNDELTDTEIARMLKDHPTYQPVKRKSKNQDQVVMDFKGYVDGEIFDNGVADDFEYVIGSGRLLPEFDKGLVGVVKDEVLNIDVVFPDDYHAKEMAGKAAQFTVTVKDVRSPKKAMVNQDFFKKVNSQAQDEETFKQEIKDRLTAEVAELTRADLVEQLKVAMGKAFKFDLPECMASAEESRLADKDLSASEIKKKIEQNVTSSIIYQAVMQSNDLKVSEKDMQEFVGKMSLPYMEKSQFIQWYLSDEKRAQQAAGLALEEKIVDHILEAVKYADKEVTYSQLKKLNKES